MHSLQNENQIRSTLSCTKIYSLNMILRHKANGMHHVLNSNFCFKVYACLSLVASYVAIQVAICSQRLQREHLLELFSYVVKGTLIHAAFTSSSSCSLQFSWRPSLYIYMQGGTPPCIRIDKTAGVGAQCCSGIKPGTKPSFPESQEAQQQSQNVGGGSLFFLFPLT